MRSELIKNIRLLAGREPMPIVKIAAELNVECRSLAAIMTDLKIRGMAGYRVSNKRIYDRETGCMIKLWSVCVDESATRHDLEGNPVSERDKRERVVDRAVKICEVMKNADWFSSSDIYTQFDMSLREFCGVLKHINLHGVGEYSIEKKTVNYRTFWRFVYAGDVELKSDVTRKMGNAESMFHALLASPVPMRLMI